VLADLILSGGTIVDGSGASSYVGDVALTGGQIAAIGDLAETEARQRLDVAGRVVCPGFIDMHAHSDLTLLIRPTGDSKTQQGVTTEVIGNCGFSPAPLTDASADAVMTHHGFFGSFVRELGWTWRSGADYLALLDGLGLSHHVVPLVGHGTLRMGAMGAVQRPPTADELAVMESLLQETLDAGYFGMSTGLVSPPSVYADTEELAQLTTHLGRSGAMYASHIRGEGHSLLRATAEALEIGERGGARTQISHHKATFRPYWGRIRQAVQLSEWAEARGQQVGFDVYPYTAGSANLTQIMPDWAHEGGTARLLERVRDPALRQRLTHEIDEQGREWDQTLVAAVPPGADRSLQGQSIAQIAERRGLEPIEALLQVIDEAQAQASMVHFAMDEDDVRFVMRHPLSMFGSDGSGLAPDGVLGEGQPHPRAYGTYPRIFGRYVRDEQVLSLEEAVHKAAYRPAEQLGLTRKGRLQVGADADVVVFNPETVNEEATYTEPHRFPTGIDYVVVAGEVAVDHGSITSARPGRLLRRPA
jgi:N-acyl-D-amino-acid deacylase